MSRSSAVEQFVYDCLNKEEVEKKKQCNQILMGFCDNKIPDICIFGAGNNGKKLYYELVKRIIKVDCFSDNNSKKWGVVIEDTLCIPPSYLQYKQGNRLVILAMDLGKEEVKTQMKSLGVLYVISEEELMDSLCSIPPIMPFGCIEKIDYTSKENQYLIGKFNTIIQDTCAHYENEMTVLKKKILNSI